MHVEARPIAIERVAHPDAPTLLSQAANRTALLYLDNSSFLKRPDANPWGELADEFPQFAGGIRIIGDVRLMGEITEEFCPRDLAEKVRGKFSLVKDPKARKLLGDALFYRMANHEERRMEDLARDLTQEVLIVSAWTKAEPEDVKFEHLIAGTLYWHHVMDETRL